MPNRLQLGASRLENLSSEALKVFLDKSWVHLGDQKKSTDYSLLNIINILRYNNLYGLSKIIFTKLGRFISNYNKLTEEAVNDYYLATNFMSFFYKKGSYLPFKDSTIDYIYSEHFFEHLFIDEALSLFKECYRILKWNGVIRTCVPDADLRPKPEPIYPSRKMDFTHPDTHKTRWSVYSLSEIIKLAGFEAMPIKYYSKSGLNVQINISILKDVYRNCADQKIIFDFSHIIKKNSLIVDGQKIIDRRIDMTQII
jgi:predicted SAM-dependent methyltransferase